MGDPSSLPKPRLSPDAVGFEVTFVHIPRNEESQLGSLWHEVDEQRLSHDLRRQLQSNGFRCGVFGSQLPSPLAKMFTENRREKPEKTPSDGKSPLADSLETSIQITGEEDSVFHQRQLKCRSGKRAEIIASSTQDEIVALTREQGAVRGETYQQAQCLFAARAFPQGDGRVRLELTPEIHHGSPHNRWVGRDGVFRLEAGRDRKVLSDLRIEVTLSPGQSLLLASTPEAYGLGRHFFTDDLGGTSRRKLLLIRLVQTQHDDLFAPENIPSSEEVPAE